MARLTNDIKTQLEKIVSEKGCCLSSDKNYRFCSDCGTRLHYRNNEEDSDY